MDKTMYNTIMLYYTVTFISGSLKRYIYIGKNKYMDNIKTFRAEYRLTKAQPQITHLLWTQLS